MGQEYKKLEGYNVGKGSLSNIGVDENAASPGYQTEIEDSFKTIFNFSKNAKEAINSGNEKKAKKILANIKKMIDNLIKFI